MKKALIMLVFILLTAGTANADSVVNVIRFYADRTAPVNAFIPDDIVNNPNDINLLSGFDTLAWVHRFNLPADAHVNSASLVLNMDDTPGFLTTYDSWLEYVNLGVEGWNTDSQWATHMGRFEVDPGNYQFDVSNYANVMFDGEYRACLYTTLGEGDSIIRTSTLYINYTMPEPGNNDPSPVPVPPSLLLLGCGLGFIGVAARFRRK